VPGVVVEVMGEMLHARYRVQLPGLTRRSLAAASRCDQKDSEPETGQDQAHYETQSRYQCLAGM
jgi:hypothetical protein